MPAPDSWRNMKKIVLIGLLCESNLGDPLSFDCTEYLIRKFDQDVQVSYLDFYGRSPSKGGSSTNRSALRNIVNKAYAGVKRVFGTRVQALAFKRRKEHCEKYYDEHFKDASLVIIVAAGTITYKGRLDCGPYYDLVAKYAAKYNIPVVVNSGGVENAYNAKDKRCQRLSNALSSKMFKYVTTRDNYDELVKYVTNPDTKVAKIADVGVWASESFGINKDMASDITGIGIITHERFAENKKKISHSQYNNTMIEIIRKLEAGGKHWKMFTNGLPADYKNAVEICDSLNLDPNEYILVPKTPSDLVSIISSFSGIITTRLHSCIVAYSLDIPFVSISWNNKLNFFSDAIGYPERTIDPSDFSSDVILSRFANAMNEGYDQTQKEQYRNTDVEYIRNYLELM